MKKLLIFGGSGKLGSELNMLASQNMEVYCPTHEKCDITNYTEVCQFIQKFKPDITINAAAIVGFLECENNMDLAWSVNVLGALYIAKCCYENNTRLTHISTSILFDGNKGNYVETDCPSPTNYYAVTKVAAEQSVSVLDNSVIIRLDFYPSDKLKYNEIFTDHFTSKISVTEAAKKVLQVAESAFTGIINIGTKRDSLYNILKPVYPNITPILISQSKMPNYPRDISLDLSKWNSLKFK